MTARPFRIAIAADEVIGVLRLPAERPCPCVVACHGVLVIQGGRDEVVPLAHGQAFFDRCEQPEALCVIGAAAQRASSSPDYS